MPTLSSYLFEVIVLNYYNAKAEVSDYIDFELRDFWTYFENAIYYEVKDPKGFQGNLNQLNFEKMYAISQKAKSTKEKALEAYNAEIDEKNQAKAISKWREIFGSDFPQYK